MATFPITEPLHGGISKTTPTDTPTGKQPTMRLRRPSSGFNRTTAERVMAGARALREADAALSAKAKPTSTPLRRAFS